MAALWVIGHCWLLNSLSGRRDPGHWHILSKCKGFTTTISRCPSTVTLKLEDTVAELRGMAKGNWGSKTRKGITACLSIPAGVMHRLWEPQPQARWQPRHYSVSEDFITFWYLWQLIQQAIFLTHYNCIWWLNPCTLDKIVLHSNVHNAAQRWLMRLGMRLRIGRNIQAIQLWSSAWQPDNWSVKIWVNIGL